MIYLIDDQPLRLRTWTRYLHKQGYKTRVFTNPDEVLTKNLPPPTLILTDLGMPTPESMTEDDTEQGTRTGLQVFRKIKAKSSLHNVPVAMFTNYNDVSVQREVEGLQSEYLRKRDYPPKALVSWLKQRGIQPGS